MPRAKLDPVTIIGIDPGETTGVAMLTLDYRWLKGVGSPDWLGLGNAIVETYVAQIGLHPKAFNYTTGRSRVTTNNDLEAAHLPVIAQPLENDAVDKFFARLEGAVGVSAGDLTALAACEIRQVRQIAGLLENHPQAAIVIEGFTLRKFSQDPRLLSPERLRFAITNEELLHGSAGRIPFVQQPAHAMTTATDERLGRAKLYYPGMVHATDAMRHAATFARSLRADPELRAAAFPRHFKPPTEE